MLEGVYVPPQNKEESRKNVEQVLQFISSRHIRMSHISARGKSEIYVYSRTFSFYFEGRCSQAFLTDELHFKLNLPVVLVFF